LVSSLWLKISAISTVPYKGFAGLMATPNGYDFKSLEGG
jgi:hypothetical protein